MNRRGFLSVLGLSPAVAVIPAMVGKSKNPDIPEVPHIVGIPLCSCGYQLFQSFDAMTVECSNARCKNFGVKFLPWRHPLERA